MGHPQSFSSSKILGQRALLPCFFLWLVCIGGGLSHSDAAKVPFYSFVCPTRSARHNCPVTGASSGSSSSSTGSHQPQQAQQAQDEEVSLFLLELSQMSEQVETGLRLLAESVLGARYADVAAIERHEDYETLFRWLETIRILDCVTSYPPPCVGEAHYQQQLEQLCRIMVRDSNFLLEHNILSSGDLDIATTSHTCWAPGLVAAGPATTRAAMLPMVRSIVEEFVGTADISLQQEWQIDRAPEPRNAPLVDLRSMPVMLYPFELSPKGSCHPKDFSFRIDEFAPELEKTRPWRDVSGLFASPFLLSSERALQRLHRLFGVPLSRFLVNLGAANGACGAGSLYDPANCLLRDRAFNATAILFEGHPGNFEHLLKSFGKRRKVHLRLGYTTPSLAVRDTLAVSPGFDIDLLKVDVDNCDSCFVQAFLEAGFRPKLIHVELTAPLPPPIKARVLFSLKDGDNYRMCGSLSEFLRVAPGYKLLHVEYVNALLVRDDLFPLLAGPSAQWLSDEEKWRLGYFCHPFRPHSTWGEDRHHRREGRQALTSLLGDPNVGVATKVQAAKLLAPEEAARQRYVVEEEASPD